jgi:hypothetical protein
MSNVVSLGDFPAMIWLEIWLSQCEVDLEAQIADIATTSTWTIEENKKDKFGKWCLGDGTAEYRKQRDAYWWQRRFNGKNQMVIDKRGGYAGIRRIFGDGEPM